MTFVFNRINQSFIAQAPAAVAIENAAEEVIAMVYRGSSDDGHKYCSVLETALIELKESKELTGVQMNDTLAIVLTIASEDAFFSFV